MQLKVKVAPEHPLTERLAHTLYSLQLLRIYAATLAWVWSLLDLSMSAPKFIRISHSHSITKSNSMTMTIMMLIPILIRCHSIRFSFRICLLVLLSNEKHFVFCFLVFLFSVFFFQFLFSRFVLFIFVLLWFLLLLSSLPSCVFYFHFLRNFIYFAVAAVAILHFALAQLPRPPLPLCLCLARPLVQYLTPSPSLSRHLLSCSPTLLFPSPSRFL